MAATLEHRRLAIAAALRAIMAEPLLPAAPIEAAVEVEAAVEAAAAVEVEVEVEVEVDQEPVAVAPWVQTFEPEPIEALPAIFEPVAETITVDTHLPHRPSAQPPIEPSALPSLRAVLTAQIDWDEVDEPADEGDVDEHHEDKAVNGAADPAGGTDDSGAALAGSVAETPSVPPIELTGSMSRAASMALFGHA